MPLSYLKALALIHGIFGVCVFVSLPIGYYQGAFSTLTAAHAAVKITGSMVSGALLLACMLSAWSRPSLAPIFAWLSLATFVVGAPVDTIAVYGSAFAKHLIPVFYYATVVRAVAATGLWLLARNLAITSA